jgi:putative transcriptional regulator
MCLRKLGFFPILATIASMASVGRLNAQTKESDGRVPNLQYEALIPYGSPWHMEQARQPANRHWVTPQARSEMSSTVIVPVQSRDTKDLGAGKLLVASRNLGDPNFAETVVLLVHYDAEGVVGLILNRRTDLPLSRVFEGPAAKERSDPIYLGGPVETSAALALVQSPRPVEGAEHIFGGVYLISTKTLLERTISTRPDPGVFHVYLGYAGWATEQLRMEVGLGSWFIFQAHARTVFDLNPDSLWPEMIRKTELKLAMSEPAQVNSLKMGIP